MTVVVAAVGGVGGENVVDGDVTVAMSANAAVGVSPILPGHFL